ncbi:ficolin-1-like [Drosophila tropicalis]|uniref:ficolin-1-like n=1 Tax=Drosophila tropicalis TaxID=46794 RepID=UPI0035ABABF2
MGPVKGIVEKGIFEITVPGLDPFPVMCDAKIAGAGWTVIASRSNVNLNFFRNWTEYKRGFGDLSGDFFIGLDKLHAITKSQSHELYIHLEDFSGVTRFAQYDDFYIENENVLYKMTKLGTATGDAGDSLKRHKGHKFSTYDRDHDSTSENCALTRLGAWWYDTCTDSNLFGIYFSGTYASSMDLKGMFWSGWHGSSYSYKTMKMMVRPKCRCS